MTTRSADGVTQATRSVELLPACVSIQSESDHQLTVTIRQLVTNRENGLITQNPNDIVLEMKDFSQLMWHLKSIENDLINRHAAAELEVLSLPVQQQLPMQMVYGEQFHQDPAEKTQSSSSKSQ